MYREQIKFGCKRVGCWLLAVNCPFPFYVVSKSELGILIGTIACLGSGVVEEANSKTTKTLYVQYSVTKYSARKYLTYPFSVLF